MPNRGSVQADAFLNGVPYLQTINDITTGTPTGIHVEPGIWMIVPVTTDPAVPSPSLVRMASIPHGAAIVAQGTFSTSNGPPNIPVQHITPFSTVPAGTALPSPAPRGQPITFASQTATAQGTARLPQDLSSFIAAGTITQAMLDDPNSILREQNQGLNITQTIEIVISTSPAAPLFGGGTDNIAFLLGDPAAVTSPLAAGENAQTLQMTATFWIETVEYTINLPRFQPGDGALKLSPRAQFPGQVVPSFLVTPPFAITSPTAITVTSTQIQYSQVVMLNFKTLTWPHVSVATLVPA